MMTRLRKMAMEHVLHWTKQATTYVIMQMKVQREITKIREIFENRPLNFEIQICSYMRFRLLCPSEKLSKNSNC